VINDLNGRTRAYGVNFIGLMLDRECLEIAAGHAPRRGTGDSATVQLYSPHRRIERRD